MGLFAAIGPCMIGHSPGRSTNLQRTQLRGFHVQCRASSLVDVVNSNSVQKRYAYFRGPTGAPYKGADGKYAPTAILAHLGSGTSVASNGSLGFGDFRLFQFEPVLQTSVAILTPENDELNDEDAQTIVRNSMHSAIRRLGGNKAVPPLMLLAEADRFAAELYRKPVQNYVVLSAFSVNRFPATSIVIDRTEIQPLKSTKRYTFPGALVKQPFFDEEKKLDTRAKNYQQIAVNTAGRTTSEAVEKAFDAVNYLRALWTLFGTFGRYSLSLGGTRTKPIGVVRTGPTHTIHHPDGNSVGDFYWYEREYSAWGELFAPKDSWPNIEKNRRWAMRRISKLKYGSELRQLLARYAAALDHVNLDLACLQMWGILERITDTIGKAYDETIARATWFEEERDFSKEILEVLRLHRNGYVHAARSGEGRESLAYFAKRFVEQHLLALIRNDLKVSNLLEYAQCLSLPVSIDALELKRRQGTNAIRIIRRRTNAE